MGLEKHGCDRQTKGISPTNCDFTNRNWDLTEEHVDFKEFKGKICQPLDLDVETMTFKSWFKCKLSLSLEPIY